MVEYVEHLHEHFEDPVVIESGRYVLPKNVGYSSKMKQTSIEDYEYPEGKEWKKLFAQKKFMIPTI